MEIKIDVSMENEGTDSPWWVIVDPKQMMSPDPFMVMMSMVTGPFFSREEAALVLKSRRHHFSPRAVVYCASGCDTIQYREQYRKAEIEATK